MIVHHARARSARTAQNSVAPRPAQPEISRREAFREFDLLYTVAALTAGKREGARRALPQVMTRAYRQWSERPTGMRPRVWLLKLVSEEMRAAEGESNDESETSTGSTSGDGSPSPRGNAAVPPLRDAADPLSPVLVRNSILELARDQREVLALSEIAGLSYQEIGTVLEVGRDEARERLYVARQALRDRLFRAGRVLRPDRTGGTFYALDTNRGVMARGQRWNDGDLEEAPHGSRDRIPS